MNKKVLKEAMIAYADCNMGWEEGSKIRNLHWEASEYVNREEAEKIMEKALGESEAYNDFHPSVFSHLPENAQIKLARESSVCIYVKRSPGVALSEHHQDKMGADEFNYYDKQQRYRFWWD